MPSSTYSLFTCDDCKKEVRLEGTGWARPDRWSRYSLSRNGNYLGEYFLCAVCDNTPSKSGFKAWLRRVTCKKKESHG
jgi:hypothetical protein